MGAVPGIDITFREDVKVRATAAKWYQLQGLAQWDRRLARLSSILSVVLNYFGAIAVGGALGALVSAIPVLGIWPTVFIGMVLAWISAHRWMVWSTGLAQKIHAAHETGGCGAIRCRFDTEGFTIWDTWRDWRSDWHSASRVEARSDGLFIAREGLFFYFPAVCWDDPACMRDDTKTTTGWWRRATGRPA